MNVHLSRHEVRTILNWWASSRGGLYGSLGTALGTLREITLADRLSEALNAGNGEKGSAPAIPAAVRDAEDAATRVVYEELARVEPDLARHGHETVFAGVVHSMSAADPQYWSVLDFQIEPVGAERPTYRFLSSDIPVWRDGQSVAGPEGEALRAAVRQVLARWLAALEQG